MAIRPKPTRTTSVAEIEQLKFNERAQGERNVIVGGAYDILGACATALRVGEFATLMIANTSLTVGYYVKFGDSTVAAPTGLADGIWCPPASLTYLNSGITSYIRSNNAAIGVYKLQEFVTKFDDANVNDPGT